MQTSPTVGDRSTVFVADVDAGETPGSLKAFGGGFIGLWLGMLALVYVVRRKQLALKSKLATLEASLEERT